MKPKHLLNRLSEERVGVYGFGRTGQAVVEFLQPIVESLVVLDDAAPDEIDNDTVTNSDDITWIHQPTQFRGELDRLIVSPGISGDHSYLRQVRESRVPVWGELELGYRLADGEIWGITGTNGKSTTTRLLTKILKSMQTTGNVVGCGNNGFPLIEAVGDSENYDHYVVEVSSFQVEGLDQFEPDGVVLTNLGIDHLDRHESLWEYHGLKWQLVKRCKDSGPHSIFANAMNDNLDRPWLRGRQKVRRFTRDKIYGADTTVTFDADEGIHIGEKWITTENIDPMVTLFPENLMAALGMVADTVQPEELRRALEDFESLDHRVETIANGRNPRIINDSKATNPHATGSILDRIDQPVRIVLGGEAKDSNYDSLINSLDPEQIREIYLCGQGSTVNKLDSQLENCSIPVSSFDRWEDGVQRSVEDAADDETVLLSPAGTSFDAFDDYKDRGRHFRKWTEETIQP